MKKFLKRILNTNKLILIPSVIIAVFVLAYISRGWIRMSVVPKSIEIIHGPQINKKLTDEEWHILSPIALLGTANPPKAKTHCYTQSARKFHIEVRCESMIDSFHVIPEDEAAKKVLNENAKTLQDSLKQNGWTGEFDENGQYTSLVKLISNLTQGIDYTPDATYVKSSGNDECLFTNVTAFSKPNPPAISSHIACGKYFSI